MLDTPVLRNVSECVPKKIQRRNYLYYRWVHLFVEREQTRGERYADGQIITEWDNLNTSP